MALVKDFHVYGLYFDCVPSFISSCRGTCLSLRASRNFVPCKLPATLEILFLNEVQQFFIRMCFLAEFLDVHVGQFCGHHALGVCSVVRDVKSGMHHGDHNMASGAVTVVTAVHEPSRCGVY